MISERSEYNNVEYLFTDDNVCNLISKHLGDIWYINTGFSCEWGVSSLFGRAIVQWQFHDNCNGRWHFPAGVNVSTDNIIKVAGYGFKIISYNGRTLVLQIDSSNPIDIGFPELPIDGIYTFNR